MGLNESINKINNFNRIIFIDRFSNRDQHLSGNSSIIYKFYNLYKNIKVIYICNKNAIKYYKKWFKDIDIENVEIRSKSLKLRRKDKIIFLYPEYKGILKYFLLKITGKNLNTVVHGHLNSFIEFKYEKNIVLKSSKILKNIFKVLFFSSFNNIICYSQHILDSGYYFLNKNLYKRLLLINEISVIPKNIGNNDYQFNQEDSKIKVGFLKYPSNKNINYLYKKIKSNKKYSCKEGWKNNLSNLEDYLLFIKKCDVIVFDKVHDYFLQVSGVVNDCLSLNKIIICTKKNNQFKYLVKINLLNEEWSVENLIKDINLFPSKNKINFYKKRLNKYLEDASRINLLNIKKLIRNNKIVLAYQGRESGGGILDLYRFANNCLKRDSKNVQILTRNNKKLGEKYLSYELSKVENKCNFVKNKFLLDKDIYQLIFIMPNIKDFLLLIYLKIFRRDIIISSIIHNPPNWISSRNSMINAWAKLQEDLRINLSDDLIFLSEYVKNQWTKIEHARLVPLPLVNKNQSITNNKNFVVKSSFKIKNLLVVGRYLPYKDLDLLVKAISSSQNVSKHRLTIAGKDYPRNTISNIKKACEIKSWEFKRINDFLELVEIETLIKESDFILFLYKKGSQSGFLHLSKELNKPIICSNVGGLKENLENGGKGFSVNYNFQEITNLFNKIYSNNYLLPRYETIERNIFI